MSESNKPGVKHVFDDIEEMDNHLPRWWVYLLWGTILFAFGYWFYFQASGLGPTIQDELKEEQALLAAAAEKASLAVPDEKLVELAHDPVTIQLAEQTFAANCASCHGAKAQGVVGPNLTDAYWIDGGGKPGAILATISKGRSDKGMPAWGPVLGPDRVRALAAWVVSLKGTNVPGKPPQGELVQ